MSKILISSNPDFKREKPAGDDWLNVSELFSNTIQGEGISTGVPATFLRLQHCTLSCTWCDTTSVWKHGNPYSYNEIFELFSKNGIIEKFREGQHLVLTGGSPLLQQNKLEDFLEQFHTKYGFLPFIEVENECMIKPTLLMSRLVNQWNNSPKTSNSGMKQKLRHKPDIIRYMSILPNSTFKFVINSMDDWNEILEEFFFTGLIQLSQIILMPCGENQEQLNQTRSFVSDLACEHNVRYSDRLHIVIWDKKTGV